MLVLYNLFMNKKQYFSDLLFLSPSFSLKEKREIFQKYIHDESFLDAWISILEEELQKITNEYIAFEGKKLEAIAKFLKNFDSKNENFDHKYQKIQEVLHQNQLKEAAEKAKENIFSIM